MSVWLVFGAALVTALATGLGALPLMLGRRIHGRRRPVDRGGGGLHARRERRPRLGGGRIGIGRTAAGAAVGVAFIVGTRRLLGHRREVEFGALRGADALGALMVVGVMTVHSFTEGIGVGVRSAAGRPSVR